MKILLQLFSILVIMVNMEFISVGLMCALNPDIVVGIIAIRRISIFKKRKPKKHLQLAQPTHKLIFKKSNEIYYRQTTHIFAVCGHERNIFPITA